ncbi:hypothetical protein KSS87_011664, partial [Heliosperma pusillum]
MGSSAVPHYPLEKGGPPRVVGEMRHRGRPEHRSPERPQQGMGQSDGSQTNVRDGVSRDLGWWDTGWRLVVDVGRLTVVVSERRCNRLMLGDEIGKGAYGRVYKGLDLENGDFVAIKQVSLENIAQEDLNVIMNLNHKNIVKYLGSLKTKSHLHIILEYVENGSLANIIKPNKFGPFPEQLVAHYIAQVLEGLVYLHEQGVIHRDIKGANILTTKEGLVKLADFGVATKLTEADANTHSVVGTPYWMAPEVIEMSGVCAASDIWSVGCTVIELLTCVPPYYDLQPMPALFRIVQVSSTKLLDIWGSAVGLLQLSTVLVGKWVGDIIVMLSDVKLLITQTSILKRKRGDENPPIPDGLSADMSDFLRLCFKK